MKIWFHGLGKAKPPIIEATVAAMIKKRQSMAKIFSDISYSSCNASSFALPFTAIIRRLPPFFKSPFRYENLLRLKTRVSRSFC
jgi:hypothetical protein